MRYSEIIKDKKPVLVDFSAEWCGPCKAMAPILKEVAKKVGDKAKIIKIDVDKNQNLAAKLNVRGVPTFILYKEGKIIWRESGMQTADKLVNLIENA